MSAEDPPTLKLSEQKEEQMTRKDKLRKMRQILITLMMKLSDRTRSLGTHPTLQRKQIKDMGELCDLEGEVLDERE